ncbi:MAG: hypothetical protein K0S86_5941, partial [Geminicoccaceae bacterium]|nr:hypothetical protein [Geminicoccaceae bacterium]
QAAREVGGEGDTRYPVPVGERASQLLERLTAARDEDEIVAIAGEELGEVAPDAARRAGDDGDGSVFAASHWSERRRRERGHATALA